MEKTGRYVPSALPKTSDGRARIAFIGEAPARNEVAKGTPFVGPSGQLLDEVLAHHEIDRATVLLTNAASCRYPANMDELPLAAIEACRPRLVHELEEHKVEVAVAMGNSAIKGVFDKDTAKQGVNKLRVGPPKPSPVLPVSVVPTFHPAACLRNQGNFPSLVSDVRKALAVQPPEKWYEPKYVILDSYSAPSDVDEIIRRITKLNRGQGVVVDTESGNDKDAAFGNTHLENLLCIGVGPLDPSMGDDVYIFTDDLLEDEHWRIKISAMLEECGVIAHNGKYDLGVLEAALGGSFELLFDTMLAHYAIDERSGIHGLKYLATEFLGTPDYEAHIKPYIVKGNYAGIPRDLLYKYNAFDVHATRLLYSFLGEQLDQLGLTSINRHLIRVSGMLIGVERRGLGFDMRYSSELGDQLLGEKERVEAQIPFNPRSHVQVKKYYAGFGIKLPNTEADTLVHMLNQLPEGNIVRTMTERVLEVRGYSKLLGTYVTGLHEKVTKNGTVHPSFLIHGTTTGRLSARKPNTQNIPRAKELKRQFIPTSPDNVLIQCDYSQAELRVLTWLAKEDSLRAIFNDPNQDIFIGMCRDMVPGFDEMSPAAKKEARTLIKTFAYGVSYGRTAYGIASDPNFGASVETAQEFMNVFTSGIPNVMRFQDEVRKLVHEGKDLINPFGRHRRFYLITEQNRTSVENEAMAYLPQSTASDICLEAACRIAKEGIRIRNLIHDAILAEAPRKDAEYVQKRIQFHMAEVGREVTDGYVNFDTDGDIGTSWDQL